MGGLKNLLMSPFLESCDLWLFRTHFRRVVAFYSDFAPIKLMLMS